MPPEGKKQIEDHELVVLKWWIDSGASPDQKVAEAEIPDEVQAAISKLVPPEVLAKQKAAEEAAALKAEEERKQVAAQVETLKGEFPAALNFESQESTGLTFTAVSMRKDFGNEQLTKLEPIVPSLVSLDLSATTVDDSGITVLEGAGQLRMLRLSETAITDAALETLVKLPGLESLNLYGTAVTTEGVLKLAALPELKRLYLWQTQVDEEGAKQLQEEMPDCEIVLGL